MARGGIKTVVAKKPADKQIRHNFKKVHPETGGILGAIAGNKIFNTGGKHNTLGNIGKVVLDNIVSGKFKKDVSACITICVHLLHLFTYPNYA
jgi:calpain